MPLDLRSPDLAMSLSLDPYAPRAARYHVAQVDRPSPDLRDAVVLLTSELVTHAVAHGEHAGDTLELRAWMPADVVRVELRAPRRSLHLADDEDYAREYSLLLLDELADRWSLDEAGPTARMWFEIDRRRRRAAEAGQPDGAREKSLAAR